MLSSLWLDPVFCICTREISVRRNSVQLVSPAVADWSQYTAHIRPATKLNSERND